jgi:hypothetical protein
VLIEQVEPSVQGTPFTVVDAFARSAFVTSPVAVKAVVTVKLEIEGAFAKTNAPVPVGLLRVTLSVPEDVTGLPVTVNCVAGIDKPTLVTAPPPEHHCGDAPTLPVPVSQKYKVPLVVFGLTNEVEPGPV